MASTLDGMRSAARSKDAGPVRETLHQLNNAVASARVWLTVLTNTPPAERAAALPDAIERLNRAFAEAEQSCHQLRALLADRK